MVTEVDSGSHSIVFTLSADIFCVLRAAHQKCLPSTLCSQKQSRRYKDEIKHLITQLTETDNHRTLQIISLVISQSCLCLIIEKCTRALECLDTLAKRQ